MKVQRKQNNIQFMSSVSQRKAAQIGHYVLDRRRPFEQGQLSKANRNYILESIVSAILPFVKKEEPVPMAIVGYPGKSPSPLRTLSPNADRAEFESLKCLKAFTDGISKIYNPGAKLDIFSDGRVFVGSIVGLLDDNVSRYIKQITEFLEHLKAQNLKIHTLEDYYSGNFDEIRSFLMKDFPIYTPNFSDIFVKNYIKGMTIFYGKNIRAQDSTISKRQSEIIGEQIAKQVIVKGDSYSRFIASMYPQGMLRLSIHPKPFDSQKHGIFLNSLNDNCPTPWQGAAIKLPQRGDNEQELFLYEKVNILQKAGVLLVPDIDNKGCFFEFSQGTNYNVDISLHENILAILKQKQA